MMVGAVLPSKIGIIADGRAIPAWVIVLRDFLLDLGVSSVLVSADAGPGRDSAVNLLLMLEGVLQGRDGKSWTRLLDPHEIDLTSISDLGDCEVVIDLRAHGEVLALGQTRVLKPLYDGVAGELALSHALFFTGTPQITIAEVSEEGRLRACAAGRASLEAARDHASSMEAVWSRVHFLLAKALKHQRYEGACDELAQISDHGMVIPVSLTMLGRAKAVTCAAAKAVYRLCCDAPYWRVGYRFNTPEDDVWARRNLGGAAWNILPSSGGRFMADPMPVFWQGRYHIFVEELPYQTQKGIISCCTFDEAGNPGPLFPVLEEPWHLSYPFISMENGQFYMVPEASLSGEISLYRAVDFPRKWERCATLVSNVEAADATIVRHGAKLWMFAVIRPGIGGYSDTLALWSADRLMGPWVPHQHNPLIVDDRFARPAGQMLVRDGTLLRPVQDCRRGYGTALNLMKVERLDDEAFEQSLLTELAPGGCEWPGHKLHMLNRAGQLEVIDGSVIRPKSALLNSFAENYFTPRSGRD